MYTPAQWSALRVEVRLLRIQHANYKRWHLLQKQKADRFEKIINKQDELITKLEEENKKLKGELDKTKKERDTYKEMIFKAKRHPATSGKSRGGQARHTGHGRHHPLHIDQSIRVYLTTCPDCHTPLPHANATDTHTVTDIPHWKEMRPMTTQYHRERQWCSTCKKEVRATPAGVIPGVRLGLNLMTMVLLWHYHFREPFNKIKERLMTHYDVSVSEGILVRWCHNTKQWLGNYYDMFLAEVRGSPVKHADETGWRVQGDNWWSWVFASKQSTVYTIEETRGKGIPTRYLQGATGLLVRDDYGGYTKLAIAQQSCWAHLLRVARDLVTREEASAELQILYQKLTTLFRLLSEDIRQPFDGSQRQEWYSWYEEDIKRMIASPLTAPDAKKVQQRIAHQGTNLITALLYPEGVLTNNQAERDIRKMVVTRKVSGGSQSREGARTHAVNLSIIETIHKRQLPLLDTLQDYLLQGVVGKN